LMSTRRQWVSEL